MKKWVTQASMRIFPISNAWSQNLQFWKIVESWKWGKRTWTVQLKVLALPPHLHHSLPFPSYWLVNSNTTEATEEDRKYLDLMRWKCWMRRVRHGEGMREVMYSLEHSSSTSFHPSPSACSLFKAHHQLESSPNLNHCCVTCVKQRKRMNWNDRLMQSVFTVQQVWRLENNEGAGMLSVEFC